MYPIPISSCIFYFCLYCFLNTIIFFFLIIHSMPWLILNLSDILVNSSSVFATNAKSSAYANDFFFFPPLSLLFILFSCSFIFLIFIRKTESDLVDSLDVNPCCQKSCYYFYFYRHETLCFFINSFRFTKSNASFISVYRVNNLPFSCSICVFVA